MRHVEHDIANLRSNSAVHSVSSQAESSIHAQYVHLMTRSLSNSLFISCLKVLLKKSAFLVSVQTTSQRSKRALIFSSSYLRVSSATMHSLTPN